MRKTTTPLRNPPTRRRLMQPKTYTTGQEQRNNREKVINTVFNEVRQRAYVLGVRGREILLIQQSITTCSFFKKFSREIFNGI